MQKNKLLINSKHSLLVTGSNGFIGARVVDTLLRYGFENVRCFVRPSSNVSSLEKIISTFGKKGTELIEGNLLSPDDCAKAINGVSVVYHLAAGRGEKSYPSAYMNSVVTTRNLLDATVRSKTIRRFVNVSSIAVYSNKKIKPGGLLDETCEIEAEPGLRGEAYTYAKARQDDLVLDYARKYYLPCVFVRPGAVYGPRNAALTGRIGIDTFGVFLHLGGSNPIPLTYVDNCADAIVLAGLTTDVEGEVFNIVDDDLPKSKEFLKKYKKNVKYFRSMYVPKPVSYLLCYLWEKYSKWSKGQLPPVFNRNRWAADWKGNTYSNEKLKKLLGWTPKVLPIEAAEIFFEHCRMDANQND